MKWAALALIVLLAAPARAADGEGEIAALTAADDASSRRHALEKIDALGPASVPAIAKTLAELRKQKDIRAAVQKARERERPLLESLLESREAGAKSAFVVAALAAALARIGTTPAIRPLLRIAVDHEGAFKPEIARHVKTLGDRALPALLETKKESNELRHWSYAQLESMGKRVPGDAVQTKDNAVLPEVLRTFAAIREIDALPVLLSFVNSDRVEVRTAARDAILEFGQDANWKVREAYANVTGKEAPEGWPPTQTAKELFAVYDRLRLQEVYGLLDDGLAKAKQGATEEAIARFDRVLARQPSIERRTEMVPAYLQRAYDLEATDRVLARATFEKAIQLWPDGPRVPAIRAELAYLDGMDALAREVPDGEPFRRALELDPTHEKARAELARLESESTEREGRFRMIAAAVVVVIVAALGFILFGGSRRTARA
jgi:tetratricopeptide (TPR) repeat protein